MRASILLGLGIAVAGCGASPPPNAKLPAEAVDCWQRGDEIIIAAGTCEEKVARLKGLVARWPACEDVFGSSGPLQLRCRSTLPPKTEYKPPEETAPYQRAK